MTPKEVLKHFKSYHYFHKGTGMSPASLLNWLRWGYIPFKSQKKLEEITEGKLTAVWEDSLCKTKKKK